MNPRLGLALALCLASCKHYFIVDGKEVTRFDGDQEAQTPQTRAAKQIASLLKDDSALHSLRDRVIFISNYVPREGYAGEAGCRKTSVCWVLKDLLLRRGYTIVDAPSDEHDVEFRLREVWLGDGYEENREARALEEYAALPDACVSTLLGSKSVLGATTLLSLHTSQERSDEPRTFKATGCATVDQILSDDERLKSAPGGGGFFRLAQLKVLYLLAQLATDGAAQLARIAQEPGPLFTGLLSTRVTRLDGSSVEAEELLAVELAAAKAWKDRRERKRTSEADGSRSGSADSGAAGLALANAALLLGRSLAGGGARPVGNPLAVGGQSGASNAGKAAGPNCNAVVKNHTGDPQFDSFCALAGCHRAMGRSNEANQTCRALTGLSGADLSKCMYCR